ncbi:MAG: LysE family transporter [Candidatus Latescibacterota bacterium]
MIPFLFEAAFISLTGVMSPGPITAVTIGKGARSPYAGVMVAVGHGIVEFPLMAGIFLGVGYLLTIATVKAVVFSLGGVFLLFMGIGMLRSMNGAQENSISDGSTPLVAGILLSLWNPYFLIWWATVGASLIAKAVTFGILGFVVFAIVHWLCDFIWYSFLSAVSFKGGHVFGRMFQKVVFGICGVFLIFFSGKFLFDAGKIFLG